MEREQRQPDGEEILEAVEATSVEGPSPERELAELIYDPAVTDGDEANVPPGSEADPDLRGP